MMELSIVKLAQELINWELNGKSKAVMCLIEHRDIEKVKREFSSIYDVHISNDIQSSMFVSALFTPLKIILS